MAQINSEQGWAHLTHTLAKVMPQRLTWAKQNRRAIRALITRRLR